MTSSNFGWFVLYLSILEITGAFVTPSSLTTSSLSKDSSWNDEHIRRARTSNTKRHNFLKDAFDNAFANDRNLSTDKRKGQYDDMYTGEEYIESDPNADDGLTEVQRKWRQTQTVDYVKTVTPELIVGKSITMDLYLAGIPERDPSNDLYGSRVNISSRDKGTGLSLPSAPSVNVQLDFSENGVCQCSKSGFTSGEANGEWKLSDDGKVLRFSINSLGYTRTVQTKGSIQNVYWTDEEEKSVQTSTTYFIPPGMVYGDIPVQPGRKAGTFDIDKEGPLRVEKSTGLFGISSQMVACGKFVATLRYDE